MRRRYIALFLTVSGFLLATLVSFSPAYSAAPQEPQFREYKPYAEFEDLKGYEGKPASIDIQPISTDPSIHYDYDIAFVRSPRRGDNEQTSWPDVFFPFKVEPGADLMLLHPDGSEELLVKAGPKQAVADLYVSFDAKWIYYALFDGIERHPSGQAIAQSADIYKVNVKTRKIVRLTHQEYTPNTGIAADKPRGVFNTGPCPLPGGGIMFTSDRNGFVATKSYYSFAAFREDYVSAHDLQLFRMDDDGKNVETVGHLNVNTALHPSILRDGRVMFSSFENEGLRDTRAWGVWTIYPDGSHWFSLYPAIGASSEEARHFMTQLSDGHVVIEEYYFQHNLGFGSFFRMDPSVAEGEPYFGSAGRDDPRNYVIAPKLHPVAGREKFSPHGLDEITRFSLITNRPAYHATPDAESSPYVGKVTQPSGAPDNNLLAVYSTGPTYGVTSSERGHKFFAPAIHSGIYMIKGGRPIDEPAQMLKIKFEPDYNLQWPRAVVPYKRIYGVEEPARLSSPPYDGHLAKHLPEGAPFGLVGSSSVYKRESYPGGVVPAGKVTAEFGGWPKEDPFLGLGGSLNGGSGNWGGQGADAGKYSNDDVHAIRILAEEPTTDPRFTKEEARRWWNAANERFRIIGEFPVRKFNGDKQPIDPDGNPDTSFLARIPADVAWTFQLLDKNGMVLNMAETWHQIRPGEVRTDCGGCHAHSQKPTAWEPTAAAKPNYEIFDLIKSTPLLTTKKNDESHKKWDVNDETGVRYVRQAKTVEFFRDVKPILDRSCVACHTSKWEKPAGHLVLDDDQPLALRTPPTAGSQPTVTVPGTFIRLAVDPQGKYAYPSPVGGYGNGSRYVKYFQSRRSLLAWKIFGHRLDGFSNDDFAFEAKPGDPSSLQYRGKPIQKIKPSSPLASILPAIDLGYTGGIMPPPEAIAGTYKAPNGETIKVQPLSDEDRLTIVRWIDLGCPIDFDNDSAHPAPATGGWFADDSRPTLHLASPARNVNGEISRLVLGMYDYESGLDESSLQVVANFAVNGINAGANLASKFKQTSTGVWEMKLTKPLSSLAKGELTVSVKDKQGNVATIDRSFSVSLVPPRRERKQEPAKTAKAGQSSHRASGSD